MKYYLDYNRTKWNTAGTKAPDDIKAICRKQGFQRFQMPYFTEEIPSVFRLLFYFFALPYSWIRFSHTLDQGDIAVYQHPMYSTRISAYADRLARFFIARLQQRKNCKFIAVIHDLESLRGGIQGIIKKRETDTQFSDCVLLKQFDEVICHNEHMKDYLIKQGFDESRLICLQIFDYLCDCGVSERGETGAPSIAIAGSLSYGKCSYIYNIRGQKYNQNSDLTIYLYGNDFDNSHKKDGMCYEGSFKPDVLPGKLKGDFGLVWDGTSIETCSGNTGEYLKYNNPHKTSLYLASGMPVIVWNKAAIADFVLENNVGIAIENLENLDEIISGVSSDQYKIMCENANEIGKKIRKGYYFTHALEECLQNLESKN